jgi:hypothetical protein
VADGYQTIRAYQNAESGPCQLSMSDEAATEATAKSIPGGNEGYWALRENDVRIRERHTYSRAIQITTRQG